MFKFSLTKLSIVLTMSIITLFASSCKPGEEKAADPAAKPKGDLKDMTFEDIPGSSIKYARQMGTAGNLEIEGYVENDKKTGMWIEYTPDGDIQLINHYVDGLLEGTAMRMTFRNQVDLRLNYRQGKLDGQWTTYKFGKIIEERSYKNDKLDGVSKTYYDRSFKLKQEVQYKDGKQDGYFRYYDEDGNITLEYEYKNGEKVGGGIVEPKK
jgi:antitoxin component YwqK of YwqJK toxin-antitoxin module